MATNLLKTGFRLRVHNRTAEKARPLLEQGAILASSPAEAAEPGRRETAPEGEGTVPSGTGPLTINCTSLRSRSELSSAGYTFSLLQSISARDAREWRPFAGPGDAAMDPRFLAAVERSMGSEAKFWNVVIRDPAGQPAAAAVLSFFPIDGLLFVQEPWKKWVQSLRQRFPRFLKVKVLFCGCPVSTGQSHLRFAPGSDHSAILRLLDRLMVRVARAEGTPLLVFKEFDEEEVGRTDELTALGYVRADSLPMNYFPTRFRDFDHFVASVRSRYRNQIKRSQTKFKQSGLRVVHARSAEHFDLLFTEDVYRLYLSVLERAEVKLERLPAEFFRELARQFPKEAAFTFIYRGERVVAFVCGLFHGDEYLNLFCGLDYRLNEEADLYFNLMFHDVDFALRSGVRALHVGQTADQFKSRIGCYTRPRYFYVKVRDPLGTALLLAARPWLFPRVLPSPERNLFK
jgi:predicted N-acyltransferase